MIKLPKKAKVLFIDDEVENVKSFTAAFRRKYDITSVYSAEDALKEIEKEHFHIVITDQRLPGMNGTELLDEVRKSRSNTVTMLVTAYDDLKPAVEAINKGEIYHYVTKPWDVDYFGMIIDKAFDKYKTNVKLKLQNEELLKTNMELDKLIYSASHDLRGPLTSILGLTHLIRNEGSSDIKSEYLDLIDDSVKKLESILRGLGSFSENLRMPAADEEIDFKKLIYSVAAELRKKEPEFNDLSLFVHVKQTFPFHAAGERLKIIFRQLFMNASHFRNKEESNPKLEVKVGVTPDRAEIIVSDNGIGITQSQMSQVFDMFYRGHSQSRGAGIGLYIVNEAVKKLEGSIDIDSRENRGTSFKITVPKRDKGEK